VQDEFIGSNHGYSAEIHRPGWHGIASEERRSFFRFSWRVQIHVIFDLDEKRSVWDRDGDHQESAVSSATTPRNNPDDRSLLCIPENGGFGKAVGMPVSRWLDEERSLHVKGNVGDKLRPGAIQGRFQPEDGLGRLIEIHAGNSCFKPGAHRHAQFVKLPDEAVAEIAGRRMCTDTSRERQQ
jgi:hypothetical protein